MSWTVPDDLEAQVRRLWDRGLLLRALVNDSPLFPRRLVLKGPSSADMTGRFDNVRKWIAALRDVPLRITMRDINHRVIGHNQVPTEAWVDTLDDALRLIGKLREAQRFATLVELTRSRHPQLLDLLTRKPLRVLEFEQQWPLLLDVVAWMLHNPRPGVYLRQIDVPGTHTKFIEAHLGILAQMLDVALPIDAIDTRATGADNFCARFGFRDKPLHIRFRILDSRHSLLGSHADADIKLDQHSFAMLTTNVERVFVTENETNFLAFPRLAGAMVIFGSGYGFDQLASAHWLRERAIHYWGDIDTHGFAILDQFRNHFPHARSFLMDQATLFAHRSSWSTEANPEGKDLPRLMGAERGLFDQLRYDRFGRNVRLEQERIGYGWLEQALLPISG
jgi:hypothetical protein